MRPRLRTTVPSLTQCGIAAIVAACTFTTDPSPLHAAAGSDGKPALDAFLDDFEQFDSKRWYISDGWSNGDWQNCTWSKAAVAVAEGKLLLSFLPQADDTYLCGEVQSRGRAQYGTVAARMRTARHSGLNAALFTYIGPAHGQPHDEIDFEVLTRDPGSVSLNTYVDGKPHNGTEVALNPPADEAWHVYSMHWTPESVTWSIDGAEVHRTPADAAADGTLPQHPQKLYLSHWGSDSFVDWMGAFVPPSGPVVFEVDWVAYMPLGEECRFPQALSCTAR